MGLLCGQPWADYAEPIVPSARLVNLIGRERNHGPAVGLIAVTERTGPAAGVVALDDLRGPRAGPGAQRPDGAVEPRGLAKVFEPGRPSRDVEQVEDVDIVLGNGVCVETQRNRRTSGVETDGARPLS